MKSQKKRVLAIILTIASAVTMTATVSAGVFTDVENYTQFERKGNPVFPDGDAGDGNEPADYWNGNWSNANFDELWADRRFVSIEDGVGWNGSKAFANWMDVPEDHEGRPANTGFFIWAPGSTGIQINHADAKYLRVWVDYSNVNFRKASFGFSDKDYNWYDSDAYDEGTVGDLGWFYYSADGENWEEGTLDSDGCFGVSAGNSGQTDLSGFKGWIATPLEVILLSGDGGGVGQKTNFNANEPITDFSNITSFYHYWTYSDEHPETYNNKFYVDNIEFVPDYKVFDSVIYNPPVVEDVTTAPDIEDPSGNGGADQTISVTDIVVSTPDVTTSTPSVPKTADMSILFALAGLVSAGGTVLASRKRK
ncbi:hypothetical protein FACS1894105_00930 [Clostridia bacterium]|nr:hypothetical protein FACS1894105_00930 [Clostridia bacterium]